MYLQFNNRFLVSLLRSKAFALTSHIFPCPPLSFDAHHLLTKKYLSFLFIIDIEGKPGALDKNNKCGDEDDDNDVRVISMLRLLKEMKRRKNGR